jgi:hypothetical protein
MQQLIVPKLAPIKDYFRQKLVRLSSIYYYILDKNITILMSQLQWYSDCNGCSCSGIKYEKS